MGESYTPLMAKRFNVSIPDALAERLEPHKNRISLSAVMQAALERELAQLNLSDEDKQRRASLRAVAAEAWLRRNPIIIFTIRLLMMGLIAFSIFIANFHSATEKKNLFARSFPIPIIISLRAAKKKILSI
jgi:post-segregation antitoxin (ccd killing protein)